MKLQDDNELFRQVQEGNQEAYNEIVLRHRIPAISFAYSFLHDIHSAEDVVQDVLVKIYISRDTYRPVYSFKTFLYQAIRNKCIDYLRSRKFEICADLESIAEIADSRVTEELVLQKEYMQSVLSILNNLKADYKTALYLFAAENMQYEEIARVMKKTVPQVKIIIHRARHKLKKNMREEGQNEE